MPLSKADQGQGSGGSHAIEEGAQALQVFLMAWR